MVASSSLSLKNYISTTMHYSIQFTFNIYTFLNTVYSNNIFIPPPYTPEMMKMM